MNLLWPILLLCSALIGRAEAIPVRVAAASSMGPALQQLTASGNVELHLGGSGQLSRQLVAGAPADIVMLAHPEWMDTLIASGLVDGEAVTTRLSNRLVVVSRVDRPIPHLTALASLNRIGVGAPGVPLGQYTAAALAEVGLQEALVDRLVLGTSARATLAHAHSGAVDAAVVYRSDALAASGVTTHFTVDPGLHGPILYPMALTRAGAARPEARAVYQTLIDEAAMAVYRAHGFVDATGLAKAPATAPPIAVDVATPVWRSVWVAAMALMVSLVPALGLGWLLARRQFRGKALLNTLCLSPLVLVGDNTRVVSNVSTLVATTVASTCSPSAVANSSSSNVGSVVVVGSTVVVSTATGSTTGSVVVVGSTLVVSITTGSVVGGVVSPPPPPVLPPPPLPSGEHTRNSPLSTQVPVISDASG